MKPVSRVRRKPAVLRSLTWLSFQHLGKNIAYLWDGGLLPDRRQLYRKLQFLVLNSLTLHKVHLQPVCVIKVNMILNGFVFDKQV